MDFNLLKWLFLLMSLFIVFVGNLVNFLEDYIPSVIAKSFRYGKFSCTETTTFQLIEVPKSWFRHFYVFASCYSFYALYLAVDVYLYQGAVPTYVLTVLDATGGSSRTTNAEPFAVLLALTLISFQCTRRFYETWFVSVFSKGKMNLSHYMVGFIHYWGAITVVLMEAKGFGSLRLDSIDFGSYQLSFLQVAGVIMFLYAWYYQFQCAIILARLRKNSSGQVVTAAHKIPRGGLFELVSSPHLTCEVFIYFALYLILKNNSTFFYVLLWVASNQIETAFLNHWWYKKTFKTYPRQRKAFIPYLL